MKLNDDLMSATRYGMMMKRQAIVQTTKTDKHVPKRGPVFGASANSWMGS